MEEYQRNILLCEDTIDGIFTAIYKAWEMGTSKTIVQVAGNNELLLFAKYINVDTDEVLANKVANSIKQKISDRAYSYIYQAALSNDIDKAQSIYRFLVKGFRIGSRIVDCLQDNDVCTVFEMSRFVGREAHNYLGFVRFEELSNGVLMSKINPKSNVIPIIADHFSDRFRNEDWVIVDTNRNFAALHRHGIGHILISDISEEQVNSFSNVSDKELEFQQLWQCFFSTIAIKERANKKQQNLMMPYRYRKYMKVENNQ